VGHVAAVDEVVDARGGATGALDQLEERWRLEPVTVEADEEIANERAKAFLGNDPEIIAVIGNFVAGGVEPRRPCDTVLGRVGAGDDGGRRGGSDGREDGHRRLVHAPRVGDALEIDQPPSLDCGTDNARRGSIDDDE
jgi:hypothetical protein